MCGGRQQGTHEFECTSSIRLQWIFVERLSSSVNVTDFFLHCSAGKDIFHYDIKILPSNECTLNKYTFTSLPDAVVFYTENRLGTVFLKEPVSSQLAMSIHVYSFTVGLFTPWLSSPAVWWAAAFKCLWVTQFLVQRPKLIWLNTHKHLKTTTHYAAGLDNCSANHCIDVHVP